MSHYPASCSPGPLTHFSLSLGYLFLRLPGTCSAFYLPTPHRPTSQNLRDCHYFSLQLANGFLPPYLISTFCTFCLGWFLVSYHPPCSHHYRSNCSPSYHSNRLLNPPKCPLQPRSLSSDHSNTLDIFF